MSEAASIAAIVLAAGFSRRFGADKLQHSFTFNGTTLPLLAHSLAPWLTACTNVTVVTRPESTQLRNATEAAIGKAMSQKINWMDCEVAAEGMAASLRCGVRANLHAAGWLIGLADMPAVSSQVIEQVRENILSGASIAAPEYQGKRGHPVGFARTWLEQLLALEGDTGARSLLEQNTSLIRLLAVENTGIHLDIDSPSDMR